MTSKQLEQLNRKTRILQKIAAGVPYNSIAAEEAVSNKYVSIVGTRAGFRVPAHVRHIHQLETLAAKRKAAG